ATLAHLLPEQVLAELRNDTTSKGTLWERVVEARLLPEEDVLSALATRSRLPVADLELATVVSRDALPEALARRYSVVPLRVTDAFLEIATANPFDVGAEQSLAFATGREVRLALASPIRIREKLDELYGASMNEGVSKLIEGMDAI